MSFYKNIRKRTTKECKELASILGIKFLSTSYCGTVYNKYKWKCNNNHIFEASYNNVKKSYLCYKCLDLEYNITINIDMIRFIFEYIFKDIFPSCKPSFLVSKYNPERRLNIHGYNEHQKIGFIYMNPTYYHYIESYHRTKKIFENSKDLIEHKVLTSKNHDVTIITISYLISRDNLIDYIYNELKYDNINKDIYKEFKVKFPEKDTVEYSPNNINFERLKSFIKDDSNDESRKERNLKEKILKVIMKEIMAVDENLTEQWMYEIKDIKLEDISYYMFKNKILEDKNIPDNEIRNMANKFNTKVFKKLNCIK